MQTPNESDVRPLSRGYSREPAVQEEIRFLQKQPHSLRRRWLEIVDPSDPRYPHPESLVFWVREYLGRGEQTFAWRIADTLIRRVEPTVSRYLSKIYGLTRDQRVEISEDLALTLYTEWMSLEPAHEFWEVRFGICLKRKVIDAITRHRRIAQHEVMLAPQEEDANSPTEDPLSRFADEKTLSPEVTVMMKMALDSLPEPLRTGFYLYHHEGWTEESIAEHLAVTSRTVRNYLRRAERHLAQWREAL